MIKELDLNTLGTQCHDRLSTILKPYLQQIKSTDLKSSIEYTLANPGKRLRPLLIYATGLLFDAPWENMDLPACAVELIHTYSLIHDDLPCMDNADLRRGKPTCHMVYSEGMAVLTGDAIHTLAIQILASHPAPIEASHRLQMITVLSEACGPFGMAAGQALDIIQLQQKDLTVTQLQEVYRLKTGKLFSACVELGRLSANNTDTAAQEILMQFADDLGFAFQIQDDILDVEASTLTLGKPQGCDNKNDKYTYPKLMGLAEAKELAHNLYHQALKKLDYFGENADLLRTITHNMLKRKK